MREKSGKRGYKKKIQTVPNESICSSIKRRGRPRGAKNKPKNDVTPLEQVPASVKRRGRPKGSKNKAVVPLVVPTTTEPVKRRGRPKGTKNKAVVLRSTPEVIQSTSSEIKRRGRPKGAKNKSSSVLEYVPTPAPTKPEPLVRRKSGKSPIAIVATHKAEQPVVEDHPLQIAASWIEKNMHHSEMQYYRSRASKAGTSLRCAMMSDMLGFFNVKDTEINKQVKKNNFIVTTIPVHGIHNQNT